MLLNNLYESTFTNRVYSWICETAIILIRSIWTFSITLSNSHIILVSKLMSQTFISKFFGDAASWDLQYFRRGFDLSFPRRSGAGCIRWHDHTPAMIAPHNKPHDRMRTQTEYLDVNTEDCSTITDVGRCFWRSSHRLISTSTLCVTVDHDRSMNVAVLAAGRSSLSLSTRWIQSDMPRPSSSFGFNPSHITTTPPPCFYWVLWRWTPICSIDLLIWTIHSRTTFICKRADAGYVYSSVSGMKCLSAIHQLTGWLQGEGHHVNTFH